MPSIELKHIVSFSSEDPTYPADNLLKPDTYRKWQCADPNEKQAFVIIELEKASKITSLDIGNNGSAFVEVLVCRSPCCEYQVLLVASSFMSPAESRSGSNNNRVRMFGLEKLSKAIADQKWDRVKLVCTQPFNQTRCYGLSFVKLHTPDNTENNATKEKSQTKLGAFILKDEEVDTITSGSLFAKRKNKSEGVLSQVRSTAVELREASKQPCAVTVTSLPKLNLKKEKTESNKVMSPNLKRSIEPVILKSPEISRLPSKTKIEVVERASKKPKVVEVEAKTTQNVALDEILKDVVFVLSGFKNPKRGRLRDKAISMGARYRGDWDRMCTHLICAFINTPKYSQVKGSGKGKIVSEKWVDDCLSRKCRLSEKRYRVKGDDSESGSSTDEDIDTSFRKSICTDEPSTSSTSSLSTSTRNETCINESNNVRNIEDVSTASTEILEENEFEKDERRVVASEEDDDVYNCSTECESEEGDQNDNKENEDTIKSQGVTSTTIDLLDLPSFFANMTFFLYGEFEVEERRLLMRYITAYDGQLEEYMSEKVKYIVTNEDWDDNFDEALVENSTLTFVTPKWIYSCHEKRLLVPFQPYIVVP